MHIHFCFTVCRLGFLGYPLRHLVVFAFPVTLKETLSCQSVQTFDVEPLPIRTPIWDIFLLSFGFVMIIMSMTHIGFWSLLRYLDFSFLSLIIFDNFVFMTIMMLLLLMTMTMMLMRLTMRLSVRMSIFRIKVLIWIFTKWFHLCSIVTLIINKLLPF